MNAERLVILLGAGSSYDCVDSEYNLVEASYRPPLVHQLFDSRACFDDILNKYPGARARADEIRTALKRHNQPLEKLLRQMAEGPTLSLRRTIWEVPLYLQELLGEVSTRYVKAGSTKFETMLSAVMGSSIPQILILTVNYDLFVEQSIGALMGHTFTSIENYIWKCDGQQWALIKLHGSVNWGRQFNPGQRINHWKPVFNELIELALQDDISILPGHTNERRFIHPFYYYPALSLPVEGKTDFVCPKQHVAYAQNFLQELGGPDHLMIIGFSGLDTHVLQSLLKSMRCSAMTCLVNGTLDNGTEALSRIRSVAPLAAPDDTLTYDGGFKQFVETGVFQRALRGENGRR
jgi:hypothetical protein